MENKKVLSMEEGLAAIMAIIDGEETATPIKQEVEASTKETVYDGYGTAISVNGKPTVTGKKTRRTGRVATPRDNKRADLLDAVEVILNRATAFKGKLGRNKQEGLVIRMEDADYTIKVQGHKECGFAPTVEGFKADRSFATRGKNVVNHSSGISKYLVSEIENQNLKPDSDSQVFLCEAKASGIRIQIQNLKGEEAFECTIKITKKNARVVMN